MRSTHHPPQLLLQDNQRCPNQQNEASPAEAHWQPPESISPWKVHWRVYKNCVRHHELCHQQRDPQHGYASGLQEGLRLRVPCLHQERTQKVQL